MEKTQVVKAVARHANPPTVRGWPTIDNGYCGAEGFIAVRNGEPWSVNVDRDGVVVDWRYALQPDRGCPECERLLERYLTVKDALV